MTYHILNGDALYPKLPLLEGVCVIMRECLIDGPVDSEDWEDFINNRAQYIAEAFGTSEEDYREKGLTELNKIRAITEQDKVFLWFEDDLFCQTNLWWSCDQLYKNGCENVNLVRPNHDDWRGFGIMGEKELIKAFDKHIRLSATHLTFLSLLWDAYSNENKVLMKDYGNNLTQIIPRIGKVVNAHIKRNRKSQTIGAPEKRLLELRGQGITSFSEAFKIFSNEMGIYGFGDLQVKRMWDRINS